MNNQKSKKLVDFPNRYQEAKSYLRNASLFSVKLNTGVFGFGKRKVCRQVLDPLIPSIKLIIIYDLNTENNKIKRLKAHFQLKRGRHIFDLGGKKWGYFMPLLYRPTLVSTIHVIRGSIVIKCLNDHIPWKSIFQRCSGPMIVNNPGVGCGKTALKYVKSNFDDQHVFIIIEKLNSGLDYITVACQHNMAERIFDIVAATCTLPRFLRYDFAILENS